MNELDLEIPGAEPDPSGKPLTVLTLFEEMKAERQRQQRLIDEAEVRERMVMGEQWRARDANLPEVLPSDSYYDSSLITENLLYPLVQTWAARVDEGRPEPRAHPVHPESGDIEDAEGGNQILDYEKQKCSEAELIAEAAVMAQCHGDCLFYDQWSEADGPHRVQRQVFDEAGGRVGADGTPEYEAVWEFGGIVEEVIAAPDYWTSGRDHYKHDEWLVVRRVISRDVARARLRSARGPSPGLDASGQPIPGKLRFPDADPQNKDFATAMDTNRRGVEAFELWLKPGVRAKGGAFALIIDGKAVKAMPYPEHPETGKKVYDGQLPGAVWKLGYIRGCPRGKTHVADAIHQQRLVNTALRSILQRAEIAKSAYLVGPSEALAKMPNAKSSRVDHDSDKDLRATMMWFEGPGVPQTLFTVYQDARAATHACFGVSEATVSGGDPTETKSGIQLREATALDAQKIRPARIALELARKKVAKDKLSLWQVHADEARLVRILGPGGEVRARWLRSADIAGADVALEIGSGLQSTHLAGMRDAEQSVAAGYLSPQKGAEMRRTGLSTTVADSQSLARVDAQAAQAVRGQPQQPMADVDPRVAAERLHVVIGSMAVRGEDVSGVVALAQAYEQIAQEKAKATAANQGAANGPGRMATTTSSKGGITESKSQPEATA